MIRHCYIFSLFIITVITVQSSSSVFAGAGNGVTFESSNLPIVLIDTNNLPISDSPRIPATMKIIYNGKGKRNSIDDTNVS